MTNNPDPLDGYLEAHMMPEPVDTSKEDEMMVRWSNKSIEKLAVQSDRRVYADCLHLQITQQKSKTARALRSLAVERDALTHKIASRDKLLAVLQEELDLAEEEGCEVDNMILAHRKELITTRNEALQEAADACDERADVLDDMGLEMECCVGTAKNCRDDVLTLITPPEVGQ